MPRKYTLVLPLVLGANPTLTPRYVVGTTNYPPPPVGADGGK